MISETEVVAWRAEHGIDYPDQAPYSPSESYPEYTLGGHSSHRNDTYRAIREVFRLAGLDGSHQNTSIWNPLGDLMSPGEVILLKPNLIKHDHPRDPDGWKSILTHGSVIRAVADYVFKAIGSSGRIVLADAPQTDSSFGDISRLLRLREIASFYQERGFSFEVIDLRREEWTNRGGVITNRTPLPGDPRGNIHYDLGSRSEFSGARLGCTYYGADYDQQVVNYHHSEGRHEYLISASVMEADVVFSIPKMKTHKKAGVTLALKNLVGVNGDKNWLPHHTEGAPRTGGDEHPDPGSLHRLERHATFWMRRLSLVSPRLGGGLHRVAREVGARVFGESESVVRSGNWWGNDTIWRTCLDLNKIVLYGNPDGTLRDPDRGSRRRHFVLVDGIRAGHGNGPVSVDPYHAGVLIFGRHPASVDAAASVLMGFAPAKIPIVREAFACRRFPLTTWEWGDVCLTSNCELWDNHRLPDIGRAQSLRFVPHFGWVGAIESDDRTGTG